MQDAPSGQGTRLRELPALLLRGQPEVCLLLFRRLARSLQHLPAEVSAASPTPQPQPQPAEECTNSIAVCLCSFHLRKKGRKFFQKLKKRSGGSSNHKGDSGPAPEHAALSEFSGLTEEVCKEAGSSDVGKTKKESTPLEPSLPGVGVLSSAATFCCGGQEVTNKPGGGTVEKSCRAGTSVGLDLEHLQPALEFTPFSLRLPPGSSVSSVSSPGGVMFVRLRVQPSAGKKMAAGGLQLGATKALPAQDAWLVLSQARCAFRLPEDTNVYLAFLFFYLLFLFFFYTDRQRQNATSTTIFKGTFKEGGFPSCDTCQYFRNFLPSVKYLLSVN